MSDALTPDLDRLARLQALQARRTLAATRVAMHALRGQQAWLTTALRGLADVLPTASALRPPVLALWQAGEQPYGLDRLTLAAAQAHHAARLAQFAQLVLRLGEELPHA